MDYKKATEFVVNRRKDDLYYADLYYDELINSNPILKELEENKKDITLKQAKENKSYSKQLDAIDKKIIAYLKKINADKNRLYPPFRCKICNDAGIVNSYYCSCVMSLSLSSIKNNIMIPLHKFSECDFNLYEKEHRERNKGVYEDCFKIISKYPNVKIRNIVIMGGTGTGKTFLAGCLANSMLESGKSVLAVSAFNFVNSMLKYHTTFDNTKLTHLTPFLDCDFLIIDDLGTESILKNVTIEYLFMIINERLNSNKLTFFTSNLSLDSILDRYGERIYSRLFDKSNSYPQILNSSDVRLKKNK